VQTETGLAIVFSLPNIMRRNPKKIVCLFALLLVCAHGFSQAPLSFFAFGTSRIASVTGDRIQIFEAVFEAGRVQWHFAGYSDFTLPPGHRSVFTFLHGEYPHFRIAIVFDDRVHFYEFNDNERWRFMEDMTFALPDGSRPVFVSPFFNFPLLHLAVVLHDRVHFYTFDDGRWHFAEGTEFELANEYSSVFGGDGLWGEHCPMIVTVLNNRVQFYRFSQRDFANLKWREYPGWHKYPERFDLVLPYGYDSLFFIANNLGVVHGNHVYFYMFHGGIWWYNPDGPDFILTR